MKQFYRHRLPHWQPPGATIFVTYRLFGSLPAEVLQRLAEEKRRLEKEPPRADESRRECALRQGKQLFALIDQSLDHSQTGSAFLARDDIAQIVIENLFHHTGNLYRLWAFVVMPNHTHLLIEPLVIESSDNQSKGEDADFIPIARISHSLKSYTAKRINQLLKQSGTVWQAESYDHWVRDAKEFSRIVAYTENNPVKAGLVDVPEKWRWSSAAFERGEDGVCTDCRM